MLEYVYNHLNGWNLEEGKIMNLSEKASNLIKGATKGKEHIKFTVGVLQKEETSFKLFDSDTEIPYKSYLYEMGSIGKTFTTSLLAKYVNDGQMNLDDSVAKYIPELEEDKYYPTLKRLATHTAGYPTRYPMSKSEIFSLISKQIRRKPLNISDYVTMNKEKMIRLAKEIRLRDKDYKWEYSNFGISLLGYAVSNVAGQSFWDLMSSYFSQDLGLKNSFMVVDKENLLNGYDIRSRDVGNWRAREDEYIVPAGAGMISNAEDLLEYAKFNMEESPDYLRLCHDRYEVKSKNNDMGLGWWIDKKNPDVYYHGGNTEGFASMLGFDKKKKTAVVILTNVMHYKGRTQLFDDILENL